MNTMTNRREKFGIFGFCLVFCLLFPMYAFNSAEFCYAKGDTLVKITSGEIYVASRNKGRLGSSLSRLPVLKRDVTEAIEESLMHKKASINNEEDKDNPLFNDGILHFSMFESGHGSLPLLVGEHAPATLYLAERFKPCTLQGEIIVKEQKKEEQPVQKKKNKKEEPLKKEDEKKAEPAPCALLSSGVLKDAQGNEAGSILAMQQLDNGLIAVVVTPKDGVFGQPGSGVALLQYVDEVVQKDALHGDNEKEKEEKEKPQVVHMLRQVSVDGLTGSRDVRAHALDCSSSAIAVGGKPLASLGNTVSLHWDKRLGRLFIGLSVTASEDEESNVAAIAVMRIDFDEEERKLTEQEKTLREMNTSRSEKKEKKPGTKKVLHPKVSFDPILSKVILEKNRDYVVARKGALTHMTADLLRVVWTGTQTPYLLVVRRDLHIADKSAIFALPLVSGKSFELSKKRKQLLSDASRGEKITAKEGTIAYNEQVARNEARKKKLEAEARDIYKQMQELDVTRGTLASINQDIEELFHDNYPYTLDERHLALEAVTADDIFTVEHEAARVGGSALKGYISDVIVRGDAVEVTVATVDGFEEIYLSRPLLNHNGLVERWTLWRPLSTVRRSDDAAEKKQRLYFAGEHDACPVAVEEKDGVVIHKRLKEADVSCEPLHQFANSVNELCKGQKIVSASEVICSHYYGEQEPLACAFSSQQMIVSSLDRAEAIAPIAFSFPCAMKSVRGCVVAATTSKIILVGGYDGLFALVDAQGNGWSLDKKLKDLSEAERAALSFVRFGGIDHVRSLVCDGRFLYVLTDMSLDRIDLAEVSFIPGVSLARTPLAVCEELLGSGHYNHFTDMVVSDKLALLATTQGLFRIGDGLDVRTLVDASARNWEKVAVPCQEGPITQLVPLSVTGLPTDCARCGGGELYVLNSYAGYGTSRITRFHVADCSKEVVSEETVKLLPDNYMKEQETSFLRINDYTTSLAIDGGSCLLVRPASDKVPSLFYQKEFPAEKNASATRFARNVVPFKLEKGESILSAALSLATGKMLVTTTQGVRVLD